ncbi:leucine-rich repeat domain-containing protein [Winogradskyella costae]|uniref:hypothetical protein n=1 Tax=Winogradskyella costae TaxID=2697008 RepID=UPI0015CC1D35|nr:hypothetical protein [Winogradskyella costae]
MNRLIIILLIIPTLSFSQTNQQWKKGDLKDLKVFTELEVALENPNEVKILDLGGQNLKEIPNEISEFKNLRVLLLGWRPKKDLDSSTHKLAKNIGGGYLHLDRKKGTVLDYNYIENLTPELLTLEKLEYLELDYNLIKSLPKELANLENLKQVSLYGNWTIFKNHKIVEELEPEMPNCEFLTANNYIKKRKKKE